MVRPWPFSSTSPEGVEKWAIRRDRTLEIGEEVVAKIVLNVARGADDDFAGDVKKDGGEDGDDEQAKRVVDDLGLGEAVLHIVDGAADDQRDENLDDVVADDGYAAPGEALPVSPEVWEERS